MRLRDKIAIVTGAGSGNGRGIALRFAEEGANIVIADVALDGAKATAEEVRALGREALVTQTDVSRRDQVDDMVAQTVAEFGRIDILVNNAGIETIVPFLKLTEDQWDRVIAVNLKGPFLCGQAVAQQMVAQGQGGKMVNIASINSVIALQGQAHYVSSKGGLLQLTKSMALELARYNINVNAIGPGVIDTAMTAGTLNNPERRAMLMSHIPMQRVGKPRDVANVALFLASDEADYMTGTIVFVDGGWLIE
jgi:NAD(P)-dependent dehydrogenase (short-subunit alcohol dehydrogenase family)